MNAPTARPGRSRWWTSGRKGLGGSDGLRSTRSPRRETSGATPDGSRWRRSERKSLCLGRGSPDGLTRCRIRRWRANTAGRVVAPRLAIRQIEESWPHKCGGALHASGARTETRRRWLWLAGSSEPSSNGGSGERRSLFRLGELDASIRPRAPTKPRSRPSPNLARPAHRADSSSGDGNQRQSW